MPMMEKRGILVGLTGNIASGKSTVSGILSEHGFAIIEADRVGWELLKDPHIAEKVLRVFSDVEKDGEISRKKLGDTVFSDHARLGVLNGIVHPPLLKELKEQIERAKTDITIVNAALIFEWGIQDWFDKIVLVVCDDEKKIERLKKKGFNRTRALQRLQSQMPESEKVKKSDFIIENNGTVEELRAKTVELIDRLRQLRGT